jgi:hypothetical protein
MTPNPTETEREAMNVAIHRLLGNNPDESFCEKCGFDSDILVVWATGEGRKHPYCSSCLREFEETAREVDEHEIKHFNGAYGLVPRPEVFQNTNKPRPDYFSPDLPIRVRCEMLAVMSTNEKRILIIEVIGFGRLEGAGISDLFPLLELPQPQFALLFARVMGIKEGV